MATVLKIDGATVDRRANRVALDRLTLSLENHDVLEFSQVATILPGQYTAAKSVELVVDGTTLFRGVMGSSAYQGLGTGPIRIGYRAYGQEWMANRIPITAVDGTGTMLWNLPATDDDYLPTLAGKTVGEIVKAVLDQHAAELAAIGVAGYVQADLDALVVVPPEPVHLTGGLWGMVRSLLVQWCNKFIPWIEPSTGLVRIKSQLGGLTPLTLTLDLDPITVDGPTRDHSECYTRVVLRGGPDVQAAFLTSADDGWAKGWTGPEEAAWTYSDYLRPKDSADVGAITALSSTTLTVQSDDGAKAWAVNYWNGVGAEVVAYDPLATGITFSESRRIVGCTALGAGGTSVLTLDAPLNNSGYTRYSIRGVYSDAAKVWRKILVTPPYVAQHLVKRFSHSVPWSPVDGANVQTTSPQAVVCHSSDCSPPWDEFPATFDVDPVEGAIWFHEPIVKPFSSQSSLDAGTPDGVPCEVKIQLPYSRGAMSVTVPASGWEGTAESVDGVERILSREMPGWLDYRDRAAYQQLAQEILDTVKDTVVEGSLTYHGKLSAALTKGAALNLAGDGFATGFEAAAAAVRTVVLDFAPDGGAATEWTTRLQFSNRMKPFSGDRLYSHPGFGGLAAMRADVLLDARGAGAQVAGVVAASQARPDAGYAGPMDLGPAPGRNAWKGPRKSTGLSEADRVKVAGGDVAHNAMEADERESERRTNARGERRQRAALAGAKGKDAGRNAIERDGRENERRQDASVAARDASRLSNALGNPAGPKGRDVESRLTDLADAEGGDPRREASEAHDRDRRDDAMLKALAAGDDDRRRRRGGGGSGIGIAYP